MIANSGQAETGLHQNKSAKFCQLRRVENPVRPVQRDTGRDSGRRELRLRQPTA